LRSAGARLAAAEAMGTKINAEMGRAQFLGEKSVREQRLGGETTLL
jgi:hypothetical protein